MTIGPRVLVVDGLSDTEEVLKAVLEPRGLIVDRIRGGADCGADVAPPSLVVIHLDDSPAAADSNGFPNVPQVIIGSAEISCCCDAVCRHHYLRKPFHYRELIQAIEELLPAAAT